MRKYATYQKNIIREFFGNSHFACMCIRRSNHAKSKSKLQRFVTLTFRVLQP